MLSINTLCNAVLFEGCVLVMPFMVIFLAAGHMLHHVNIGLKVKQCVHQIPFILMEASIQPITRTVLRVRLTVTPDFRWSDQVLSHTCPYTAKQLYDGEYFSMCSVMLFTMDYELVLYTFLEPFFFSFSQSIQGLYLLLSFYATCFTSFNRVCCFSDTSVRLELCFQARVQRHF